MKLSEASHVCVAKDPNCTHELIMVNGYEQVHPSRGSRGSLVF